MIEWFAEHLWALWLLTAILLAIIEILILDFVFIMMAISALAVAGVSVFLDSFVGQVILFAVFSITLLLGLRPPLIKRFHQSSPDTPMNTAGLVGSEALITQTVTADSGLAIIAGDTWTVRPTSADMILPEGSKATVTEIRGATAYLS